MQMKEIDAQMKYVPLQRCQRSSLGFEFIFYYKTLVDNMNMLRQHHIILSERGKLINKNCQKESTFRTCTR
uniref:Uncharacterized protein n=1 Tax=Arundo donax TaxID=35708 RepID=A0A0A9F6L5_ARUDO